MTELFLFKVVRLLIPLTFKQTQHASDWSTFSCLQTWFDPQRPNVEEADEAQLNMADVP